MATTQYFNKSLAQQMQEFARLCDTAVDNSLHAAIYALSERVVMRSPVLTGQLRYNWVIAVGQASNDWTPNTQGGVDPTGAIAMNRVRDFDYNIKSGAPIFFTNAAPYGERIEFEGYSKKAPAGMLRISCVEWPQIVDESIRSFAI